MVEFIIILIIIAIIAAISHAPKNSLAVELNLKETKTKQNWKEKRMISVTMNDQEMTVLTIAPTDADGDPAAVENVVWTTNNPDVVSLTTGSDPLTCQVYSRGVLGQAEITVEADADLGEGMSPLTETAYVTVIQSMATDLNLFAAAPTPKPPLE